MVVLSFNEIGQCWSQRLFYFMNKMLALLIYEKKWITNVENNNVEGLYMVISWITFFVFALNVFIIYSTSKAINASCDDNVVKLSLYIIIVSFHLVHLCFPQCFFGLLNI